MKERVDWENLYSSELALGKMKCMGNRRLENRRRNGRFCWVYEHLNITGFTTMMSRVPLPDKGEHVGRRGRKTTGQSWALIAGLPKEQHYKGRSLQRFIPGKQL